MKYEVSMDYEGRRKDNGEVIKGHLWDGGEHIYIMPVKTAEEVASGNKTIGYEVDRESVKQL
jgi:hypothetical protein